MSEEQIRAEFEATFPNLRHEKTEYDDDIYLDRHTDTMYHGFHKGYRAALSAKSVPEVDEAAIELRVVYEAARKFLRYNGVDKDKVNQAVDELDEAIEAVKHIDGGYKDFPLEAALSAKSVLPNQEPLGSEFEKVLYENLDSLYETSVASQSTDDRVRELEKDAARYHWLKDNYHGFAHYRSGVIPCVDLGQDIDRQIAKTEGEESTPDKDNK